MSTLFDLKDYELLVLETKPEDAVSIIECDMKVYCLQRKNIIIHLVAFPSNLYNR